MGSDQTPYKNGENMSISSDLDEKAGCHADGRRTKSNQVVTGILITETDVTPGVLDRVVGTLQQHLPLERRNCPITNIKRQIRPVFTSRISGLISEMGQQLKQQLTVLLFVSGVILATSSDLDDPNKSPDHESPIFNKGIIYARVSSADQTKNKQDGFKDEDSLDHQVTEGKEMAKEHGIELAHPPIKDKAQTGTNFDRKGIQKVVQLAQRDEVGYLIVQSVDRIGRSAAETLYFIYVLQSKCNVTLITPGGERDMGSVHGLMHTTLLSLMADVQNEIRTAKAKKSRVRGFIEQKKWHCYSPVIPVGYNQDRNGWLEIDVEEIAAVKDLFEMFVKCQSYAETTRKINEKYDGVLEGHRVKTLVQNPVYIGKPQVPEDWVHNLPYDNMLEEPNLKIIDEDTFHQTQEIVEQITRNHTTDEDRYGVPEFIEEFGLFSVIEGSPLATLLHDCGEPMSKVGKENVKGEFKIYRYRCSGCDEPRKWPREKEYDMMELLYKHRQGEWDLFN